MLVRTLFVLLLFSVLAETIVHGAHALAQTMLRKQASTAVHAETAAAVAAAQAAIAAAIAAGGDPRSVVPAAPSPVPTCALAVAAGCAMQTSATIAFASVPASTASPCAADGCTIYQQGNDSVSEGRVVATIAAQASGPAGAIFAARSERVTFRTWRVPPYAAVSGELDETLAGPAAAGQGDDGGAAPIGTAPGTLIDVIYENRISGATMPANVWQPDVERQQAVVPAWSP